MVWLSSMRWWDYWAFVGLLAVMLLGLVVLAGQWSPAGRRALAIGAAPAVAMAVAWSVYGQSIGDLQVTRAPAMAWRLGGKVSVEDVAYHALAVLVGPVVLALLWRLRPPEGEAVEAVAADLDRIRRRTWWAVGIGTGVAAMATGVAEAVLERAPEFDLALLGSAVALAVLLVPSARRLVTDPVCWAWCLLTPVALVALEWLRSHPGHSMVVTDPDEWLLPAWLWAGTGDPWATPLEQVLLLTVLGALAALGWAAWRPRIGVATPHSEFMPTVGLPTTMGEEP